MRQKLQILAVFVIALILITVYDKHLQNKASNTSSTDSNTVTTVPKDSISADVPAATEVPVVIPAASDSTIINDYQFEVASGAETISIPLKDIPELYDALVSGYDLNNADDTSQILFQLSRISPQIICSYADGYYILINYNCGVKLSDYMLIRYEHGSIETLDLDMGIYQANKISDNKYLIAFLFSRTEGLKVYDDMIVVNLREMKIIPLELPAAFSYSVAGYAWKHNELFIDYQDKGTTEVKTSINYPDSVMDGTTPMNFRTIICNSDMNAVDPYEIVFINDREGFKLVSLDYAMFQEPAELYKTEDGGKTWTMINSSEETLPGEAKSGLTFLNSKTGWIATGIPRGGYIGLYRTTDGGLTWKLQEFNIPEAYSKAEIYPNPPVFFSKKDGILIAEYYADQSSGFLAFVTHNGGKSWSFEEEGLSDKNLSWTADTTGKTPLWKVSYDENTWESSDFRTFQILD